MEAFDGFCFPLVRKVGKAHIWVELGEKDGQDGAAGISHSPRGPIIPIFPHRVDCSGRRVASLDVDGVIKVWSFNPIMQTKASSISKSPLLSLEWATKRDRLVSRVLPHS